MVCPKKDSARSLAPGAGGLSPGMEKVTQGVGKPAVEGGERRSCWIQPKAPPLRTVPPGTAPLRPTLARAQPLWSGTGKAGESRTSQAVWRLTAPVWFVLHEKPTK